MAASEAALAAVVKTGSVEDRADAPASGVGLPDWVPAASARLNASTSAWSIGSCGFFPARVVAGYMAGATIGKCVGLAAEVIGR